MLFRSCQATLGKYVEPKILDAATHEIVDQHLSSKKAREMIEWQSEFQLKEGLQLTVDWYKKYFEGV